MEPRRGKSRSLPGPPLEALHRVLASVRSEPSSIPMTGGFVGFFGYDLVRLIERLPGNPYVIAGRKPGTHLTDLQHPWQRIRKRADLEDVRIHDLRHSFASGAIAIGETLPVLGKLLGHRVVQTTARYAHLAEDPAKAAADRISSSLAGAINGD